MTTPSSTYQFPSIETLQPVLDLLRSKSDSKLIHSIKKYENKSSSRSTENYINSRETICAFHLVLNEKGLLAPAFRPFVKLSKNKGLSDIEKILGNDNQVINLHYLHCQHKGKFIPTEKEFKKVSLNDNFDFDLASEYASKEWLAETRSDISLMLGDATQLELSTFISKKNRDRRKSILNSCRTANLRLVNYSNEPRSRFSYFDIPKRMEEYYCLKLAKGSPSGAVKFYSLITGTAYNNGNQKCSNELMRKRKKWFGNKIGIRSW